MIVFLLSGIWHGANITYLIWGGLNGLYQIIGELMMPARNRLVKCLALNRDSLGHRIVETVFTFFLFCFSLFFFRAEGFASSLQIIRSVFTVYNPWILFDGSMCELGLDGSNVRLMLICIAILFIADGLKRKGICIRKIIAAQDYWCRVLVLIVSICFILMFGIWGSGYNAAGFIYFQF
jgi:D-alanyl-lipoteichoic acid acyltransferase DltB (MBOAT superfamily)